MKCLYRFFCCFVIWLMVPPSVSPPSLQAAPFLSQTPSSFWSFDSTFGSDGITSLTPNVPGNVVIQDHRTFLLPDGRIIASVAYWWAAGKGSIQGSFLVRLNQTGIVEAIQEIDERLIGIQSDSKLLTLGYSDKPYLHRYTADFVQDVQFVITDTVDLPQGGCCIIVQPDDAILIAKAEGGSVQRLQSDGSIDTTFATNVGPFQGIDSIVSGADNGFLVQERETVPLQCSARMFDSEGTARGSLYSSSSTSPDNHCSQTLLRFSPSPDGGFTWSERGEKIYQSKPDGSLNMGFGTNGVVILPTRADWSMVSSVLPLSVDRQGNVIFAGSAQIAGINHSFIARLKADGSFDNSFGLNGILTLPKLLAISDVVIQADGKLLVIGHTPNSFVIIRLSDYITSTTLFLPMLRAD